MNIELSTLNWEKWCVTMKGDLSRKVLKDVSRSFYLSLRFLPREFRAPTSVAYLLARASDTIADAGQLGIQERRDLLARFVKFVTEGKTFRMPEVKGLPEGEKVLMSRLDDCMERWKTYRIGNRFRSEKWLKSSLRANVGIWIALQAKGW